ncbi:hypothetical protein [Kordiimonas marina]|uniref:hypothetical protein n=1 Tax=Kordiimonas marina TaxID=2872312 RepID=UPI001FF1C947|nr:hypothetical protein [Kordiimonas marina]MCJ9427744.1 hypothetical protein [Kordiimonas marina]
MSELAKEESYDELMRQYLELCNKALEANKDRFPYGPIWKAAEEAMAGNEVEFALVDDAPKARMAVSMKDTKINFHECNCDCHGEVPIRRISADYIRKMLEDPEKVIEDPSLLDWDWLKTSVPSA